MRAARNGKTGCLEWRGAISAQGYGSITFLGKTYTAHRLSWLAHHGAIPGLLRVCHACDNRLCFEITHLFIGTAQQNIIDMHRKGRGAGRGVKYLNGNQVAEIKRRLADGESVADLARAMKVPLNRISKIKHGRSWKFIGAEPSNTRKTPSAR